MLTVAGMAFYKLYFLSEPEIETAPYPVAPLESDTRENTVNITEDVGTEPLSEKTSHSQTSQALIANHANKADIAHVQTPGYQNPRKEIEEKIEKGFLEKEGSHFTVKFEGGENADIGHLIAIILEEAYIKVGSDLSSYPEDRIEAALYTRQQFTDVTRAPSWAGAIYDGRIKIPIGGITSRTNLLERVLFHEYTHALVHRLSKGRAPVWLNEGLAQHEEGVVNENINQILDQVAKIEKPLPLKPFEGSFMAYNAMQASVAYSVSLSATTYIINEFGMSAVKRILENIGDGKTIEEAISESLYIPYEDLQKSWFMSLKRRFAG